MEDVCITINFGINNIHRVNTFFSPAKPTKGSSSVGSHLLINHWPEEIGQVNLQKEGATRHH